MNSRASYDEFKALYRSSALTDIQRAAKYYYLIRASYGSKLTTFGAKARDMSNTEYLTAIMERLKTVVIENKSFDALIKMYDRDGTLFYCDPPYHGSERYYDTGEAAFNDAQHIKLSQMLRSIKGKCLVSYNDSDFIRSLYSGFSIEEIERSNNLGIRYGKNKLYKELIIKNY